MTIDAPIEEEDHSLLTHSHPVQIASHELRMPCIRISRGVVDRRSSHFRRYKGENV